MPGGAASHASRAVVPRGISGLLGFRVKWNKELLLLREDACGCTDLALRAEGNSKMCLTRGGRGEDRGGWAAMVLLSSQREQRYLVNQLGKKSVVPEECCWFLSNYQLHILTLWSALCSQHG